MKPTNSPTHHSLLRSVCVALAVLVSASVAKASPYASGVTNNNGTIQFIMNEGGATVYVVFNDGTTNSMGVLPKGGANFALGAHTSFRIFCTKIGNGTPVQISTDTDMFAQWPSPRGVGVNQNPKIGWLFGRTYVGNSAAGNSPPYNKGHGLYALNSDQTDALGQGATAFAQATWANSGSSGPYKIRVAPDNTVLVGDFSTAAAALWQFQPDYSASNLVLSIIGETAAAAAGIHGDMFGTPYMTGSLAQGNLVLWTFDSGLPVPPTSIAPGLVLGPGTSVGQYNCAFRYDIGAGPLPWNNPPNYAYTMGLSGIAELRTEGEIGRDGKIIAGFGRANLSNPDIQILDPTGSTVLWTSWNDTGGASDPWAGPNGSGAQVGTYCGVRVSPDGRFLASVDVDNGITFANLTNGVPDDSSIFGIQNASNVGNSRGMSWDAADNIYVCSSGQGLLRVFSLGITTTCITSNDFTGTNGSFQLVLPPVGASIVASTPNASQNYTNNAVNPGAPIPGVFAITLTTNFLAAPVVVNFSRSGTATYPLNYTMLNNFTDAHGVVIGTNSVTFPTGTYPGGGNWTANVDIIPTAIPLTGPTLTATLTVNGGANYLSAPPVRGTVNILNTGPQLLQLSAAATGTSMNRAVPNDYAQYVITRWGDLNGPGNSAAGVSQTTYTVTNFTAGGTAVYSVDYTAGPQNINGGVPNNGTPGIQIAPGVVTLNAIVGNPVAHPNLATPPANATITLNLATATGGTNLTSSEGFTYEVTTAAVTLTEIDNTVGPEVVIWSNPLTNAADSVNWTLTYASTNMSGSSHTVLPVVVPNYTNDESAIVAGGSNDFRVEFGSLIANDSVPQSPVMAANGWTTALRMTVNKDSGNSPCAVNLYPQGMVFQGNYALRFDMYLSLYGLAINNPGISATLPREFSLFGIDHDGTNCNWRTATPVATGTGSGQTNADGVWFAIDAGVNSITPADYDAFTSPPLPNAGVGADLVSNNNQSQNGVFKAPPFATIFPFGNPLSGGEPVNQWVNVSVEVTAQTNVSVFMDRSQVLTSFVLTNGSPTATSGEIMLGYVDPVFDESDSTAFAMYSHVRVVELSPYITTQPVSLIATQGQNINITNIANFGTAPITNVWFLGSAPPGLAVLTNTANATNIVSVLPLNNVQSGTNYFTVFSDVAGSVTSLAENLEVIQGPTNGTASAGVNFTFIVTPTGPSAPTSYQWMTNGVNLTNGTHYAGATTAALTINDVQAADAVTYSVAVVNAAGKVTPSATLTVNPAAPSGISVAPASQAILWGSSASFTVSALGSAPFTYQWRKNGSDLTNGGNVTGATNSVLTLNPITTADAASYTAAVTNGLGGGISSAGVLTVTVPPPSFSNKGVAVSGGNVIMSFTSTNHFDTTNAFILQSSAAVTGPFVNTAGTFTTNAAGFEVTVPQTGGAMFYRLLHVP